MQQVFAFFLVFLGGGLGSVSRFGIVLALRSAQGSKFPVATLLANGIACFVLGVVMALHLSGQMTDHRRLLLGTGFCGGLSTFSTFIAENWGLYESGHTGLVLTNTIASLALCMLCLILGFKLTL